MIQVFEARAGVEQHDPFVGLYPALLDEFLLRGECCCPFRGREDSLQACQLLLGFQDRCVADGHRAPVTLIDILQNEMIGKALGYPQTGGDRMGVGPKIAERRSLIESLDHGRAALSLD